MPAASGPRSPPPFSSPPSLLLSSSSVADTAPGPFFFFSLAKMDDSLSGKGGISSRTGPLDLAGSDASCLVSLADAPPPRPMLTFTLHSMTQADRRAAAELRPAAIRTNQDVSASNGRELQVLDSPLLQLHVGVADLAVAAQHLLDGGLGLWEQVDKLDVSGQQQGASRHRAQVELGVEQVELDQGARYLKDRLGGVALHVVSVDDDLDDAVPHLLADVVAGDADEVQDGVHVPGVVHGVLLRENGHLQHLDEEKRNAHHLYIFSSSHLTFREE
ncbi:hypothetical protein EYF80_055642 [Liparis tanakae]|uniref:Uncharacterized protein n=1 Tax=Liparis tanakae TaxID=230148 RepID=A0A4Z2F131_9TELE|nr:hypothetical protein EYF80_055642 [Liparis tanakae]